MLRRIVLMVLLLGLIVTQTVMAEPLSSEPRSWKSPLANSAIISQGPKDTLDCSNPANWSHCSGYWNMCAVDLKVSVGTAVLAPADGQVVRTGFDSSGGGNFMVVSHNGRASLYLHLSKFVVTSGNIQQGQVIACSGIGGTGPHLHFSAMADASLGACISMAGIDGNTNFSIGQTFSSSNKIVGANPCSPSVTITPQPTLPPTGNPPNAPSLTLPSKGQVVAPETPINFEWGTSANATQYMLEYWGGPYGTLNSGWQLAANYSVGTMWPGIYNWHVKARNSGGESNWSDTWTFMVQGATQTSSPPAGSDKPTLSSPGNGSSMAQSGDITLVWNIASNSSKYKVELWGGQYGTMTPCDWQSGTSCRIGTMYPGVMQWHVKARNSSGQESDWSDTWTFTVRGPTEVPPTKTSTPLPQAPSPPSLHDPSNGISYPQSQDIWFAWNYAPNADQYYLEYWGGPYGTLNSGWINDVAYHIGTMWPGKYHWHVKSRGQNGLESNWSDTWNFTITQPADTSAPPTNIPPTSIPPTAIPPTAIPPTITPVPQPGSIVLVDDLTLKTESGNWPPQAGQKLIAHIKVKNGGDLPIHVEHIGVRGRRNGSDFWDIGFWTIDLNGHDVWLLDPNNERSLVPGNYSFRISYSLDGSNWTEVGSEINFTIP